MLPTPTATPTDDPTGTTDAATDLGDFTVDLEDDSDAVDAATSVGSSSSCRVDLRKKVKRSTSTSGRGCKVVVGSSEADSDHDDDADADGPADRPTPSFTSTGVPTDDNPTVSLATPGAAPIGVPNFFIEKFRIPPFLLPIYQAAGMQYGIRWEVLAAINEIETDYGRNLNVSSAGALGWMQFMPATWKSYGVDANRDGVKDPYNPVDAVFAAARYLKAAGADQDLRRGIFAYNHADWYVDSVLLRARMIGGLPASFVGSLTGLTQARFPVQATARYAGSIDVKAASRTRVQAGQNAAVPVEGSADRTGIRIFAKPGSPVIAVNDGEVVGLGNSDRLGRYIRIRDVYGNVFTYGHLKSVVTTYPVARRKAVDKRDIARQLELPKADPAPRKAASATSKSERKQRAAASRRSKPAKPAPRKGRSARRAAGSVTAVSTPTPAATSATALGKDRLFAHPARPKARAAGGELQLAEADYVPQAGAALKLNRRDFTARAMHKGARVLAGTILGRIGRTQPEVAPHVLFEIRPAGRHTPRIDPKPILDGWKLLESTEIYRAAGKNPFFGADAEEPSIGQILLMSKDALQRHVLSNPRIDVYECGRRDIRLGLIDRRVLATLEFLAASGLRPAVSSLQCGHGVFTTSGNVSQHSSGNAVDIAAVNGIVITPSTQGSGSITEMTIQRLLTLQGTMKPDQIISLMQFDGADNTLSLPDHDDHIHVGFRPLYGDGTKAAEQVDAALKPKQWIKLIDRLGEIDNPVVPTSPSKYAIKTGKGRVAAD